jgi:nucleoside-diphosphate-sugar epimerase
VNQTQRLLIAGYGRLGQALVTANDAAAVAYAITALRRSTMPASSVHVVRADLGEPESLTALGQQPFDSIVYCPTPDQRDENAYRHTFVDGLQNLLASQALKTDGRLIFVSSTAVYGQDDGAHVDEDSATQPAACNGQILLQTEQLALQWPGGRQAQRCCVRLAGLYAGVPQRYLRMLSTAAQNPHALQHWSNRIHLLDAARLILLLLRLPTMPTVINGVDNEPSLQADVLHWLAARNSAADTAHTLSTHTLSTSTAAMAPGASGKRISNALAHSLGFIPLYPSYRQGFLGNEITLPSAQGGESL